MDKLKCLECNGYLSTPPILKHPTLGSLCGNCACYNTDSNFVRNTEYEIVASFIDFPCKNPGCHKRLLFGKITKHEYNCIFRKYDCPNENCLWFGNSFEMKSHFIEKHNKSFIYDSFSLDLRKDDIKLFLIQEGNDLFLIQFQCVVLEVKFWVLVRYIGPPGSCSLFKYFLEIKGNESEKIFVSKEKSVQSDICVLMDRSLALEVKISEMLNYLRCPTKLYCRVKLCKM